MLVAAVAMVVLLIKHTTNEWHGAQQKNHQPSTLPPPPEQPILGEIPMHAFPGWQNSEIYSRYQILTYARPEAKHPTQRLKQLRRHQQKRSHCSCFISTECTHRHSSFFFVWHTHIENVRLPSILRMCRSLCISICVCLYPQMRD